MSKSLTLKLRFLNGILIIYSIIFAFRALYWLHDKTAPMLWFIDTPFDLIVIGTVFIVRTNLLKSYRLQQSKNVNIPTDPKLSEKIADTTAKGVGIALLLFIITSIAAAVMFAVFTSVH